MGLVANAVLLLLGGSSVISQAVGLDDETEIGPVEIDAKPADSRLRLGSGQASDTSKPEEASLENRISQGKRMPIQQGSETPHAWSRRMCVEGLPQRLGVDKVETIRIVDRPVEPFRHGGGRKVDERGHRIGDGYSFDDSAML